MAKQELETPKLRFHFFCRVCNKSFDSDTKPSECDICQGDKLTICDNKNPATYILPMDEEKWEKVK